MLRIRVLDGSQQGETFRCDRELWIGRSDTCQVRVVDSMVSRLHAKIVCSGNEVRLVDLSENGSEVDGQRLLGQEVLLAPGDRIVVGRIAILVEDEVVPPPPSPAKQAAPRSSGKSRPNRGPGAPGA